MEKFFQKSNKQGEKRIFSSHRFWGLAKRLEHRNIKGRQIKKIQKSKIK